MSAQNNEPGAGDFNTLFAQRDVAQIDHNMARILLMREIGHDSDSEQVKRFQKKIIGSKVALTGVTRDLTALERIIS